MSHHNKYRNKKVTVDGHNFDSMKESRRYHELKLLEKAELIYNLELQPSFVFELNGIKICTYKADFRYIEAKGRCEVIEDVKSVITAKNPVYRIKKKLMKAFYGVDVVEV